MGVGLLRTLVLIAIALFPRPIWAGQSGRGTLQAFVGEITDSHCAKISLHADFTEPTKSMGRDKKACSVRCIERGSKVVLYDPARRTVYTLDNPEKVLPFAGQKVRITGTLHGSEITVATIENVF
jgi:hypothetical protein